MKGLVSLALALTTSHAVAQPKTGMELHLIEQALSQLDRCLIGAGDALSAKAIEYDEAYVQFYRSCTDEKSKYIQLQLLRSGARTDSVEDAKAREKTYLDAVGRIRGREEVWIGRVLDSQLTSHR